LRLNAPDRTRIVLQHGSEQRVVDLEQCVEATGFATQVDDGVLVHKNAHPFFFSLPRPSAHGGHAAGDGSVEAPMPGKVTAVEVAVGDQVVKGQRLLTLEAMKMEHALTAPFDGTIAELSVAAGQQVQVDSLLVRVDPQAVTQ
jgi:3-methylcrotonyl-CoA carboxylase alpha subunit